MMTSQGPFPLGACAACRSVKRKCEKQLPKCSLCLRKGLVCRYNTQKSLQYRNPKLLQHQSVFSQLSPPISTPQSPCAEPPSESLSTNFLAALFLDSEIFQQFQVTIPESDIPIPGHIKSILGDISRRRSTAAHFFSFTDEWMPIISKKRFYDHVNPFRTLSADYALLILCMELIKWLPGSQSEDGRTPTYMVAKRYYMELEIAGVLSLQVLQAYILIALYELGHAIYPSALLSVAACARYGSALGLDWRTESKWQTPTQASWVELEERNRVWWALALLDRIINIGHPGRSTVIPDPEADTIIPSDDKAWDEGVMPQTSTFGLTTVIHGKRSIGAFGLAAQATRLLGQVLRPVSRTPKLGDEEALLLDETLGALMRVLLSERNGQHLNMMNQQAICHSALVMLHEAHASLPRKTDTSLYFESIHQAVPVARSAAQSERDPLLTCRAKASPFLPLLLYQVACVSLRLRDDEKPKPGGVSIEDLGVLKSVLAKFDERWKSAGAYLKVLQAREMGKPSV